jgi:hypothetical protein
MQMACASGAISAIWLPINDATGPLSNSILSDDLLTTGATEATGAAGVAGVELSPGAALSFAMSQLAARTARNSAPAILFTLVTPRLPLFGQLACLRDLRSQA